MKIFLNKTDIGKLFLEKIKNEYSIDIDYGDSNYKYLLKDNLLTKYNRRVINDKYSTYYLEIPDMYGLFSIKLCYSVLHLKYVIIAFDGDKNLITFEYINLNTVKEIIDMFNKN